MNDPDQVHPSPKQLEAFDQGQLALTDWVDIEGHLAHCETCCNKLETLPDDPLVLLLRSSVGTPSPQPANTSPRLDPAASSTVASVSAVSP